MPVLPVLDGSPAVPDTEAGAHNGEPPEGERSGILCRGLEQTGPQIPQQEPSDPGFHPQEFRVRCQEHLLEVVDLDEKEADKYELVGLFRVKQTGVHFGHQEARVLLRETRVPW